MQDMNITSAIYKSDIEGQVVVINAIINGITMSVPLNPNNRHYTEIMRQVEAGTLIIVDDNTPEPADTPE
jgi:hypothetical protein